MTSQYHTKEKLITYSNSVTQKTMETKKNHLSSTPTSWDRWIRFCDVMTWRHGDVLTSWRHVMTSQNLIHLSQLVDVLERWFFFVSMVFWVTEFINVINFTFVWCSDVMTSCHDVTKPDSPISACRCARKMILFCFHGFLGHWVHKCY